VALTATSLFTGVGDRRHAEAAVDLVVNRKGTVLWHPKAERLLGNAADEPGLGELITRWQKAGSPVDAESTAQLSQGYLVSMAGIPTTDWLHLRATPASVALQPLVAARASVHRSGDRGPAGRVDGGCVGVDDGAADFAAARTCRAHARRRDSRSAGVARRCGRGRSDGPRLQAVA
jgi:hypothetical protein